MKTHRELVSPGEADTPRSQHTALPLSLSRGPVYFSGLRRWGPAESCGNRGPGKLREKPKLPALVRVPAEASVRGQGQQMNEARLPGHCGRSLPTTCDRRYLRLQTATDRDAFPPLWSPPPGDAWRCLNGLSRPPPLCADRGSRPLPAVTFLSIRTRADKQTSWPTVQAVKVGCRDGGLAFPPIDQRRRKTWEKDVPGALVRAK